MFKNNSWNSKIWYEIRSHVDVKTLSQLFLNALKRTNLIDRIVMDHDLEFPTLVNMKTDS